MVIKRFKFKYFFLLLIIISAISNPSNADIYKWVDENGRVYYGDKPVNRDSRKLEIKEFHVVNKSDIQRESRRQKLLDVMAQERLEKRAKLEESRKQKKEKVVRCSQAQKNLTVITSSSYLMEETDDPYNPKILSEDERHFATLDAKKAVDYWCSQ